MVKNTATTTAQVEKVGVELPAKLLQDQSAGKSLKPTEVADHIALLRGFRDLVAERMGYFMGRRLTQQDMTTKTEAERKAVAEARKAITGDNLKTIITKQDIKGFEAGLEKVKKAREALSTASKPFREKMNPLAQAQKYLDNVAIPDGLKELGTPIQPRFSLSKWIGDTLAQQKKKN